MTKSYEAYEIAPLPAGSPWLDEIRELERRMGAAYGGNIALIAYIHASDSDGQEEPASPS
ncbi:hypothetical protein ACFQWB_10665 [Paenibacillus thermoaerophilus]|uniref:Uncharacterized protein n=1 Tax=Paenibacillus thermoaerophilus TaxID=1215385 RepID=A0ABW2V6A0_9BACL|nr:hypothetical protein [Paenibacillus thermoaerophilus]TMV18771.1 hypothetical protein FE781_02230 [Paenibacillus thermoaerophilus]